MSNSQSSSGLLAWREKHLLLADGVLAGTALLILAALALWQFSPSELSNIFDGSRTAIYTTTAAITGSLLGFVLTAVSIIAVFFQSPRFAMLAEGKAAGQIFGIYTCATRSLAITTIWMLVAIVFDTESNKHLWITAIAAWLATFSAARVARCVWALEKMIVIATTPIPNPQAD